MRSLPTRPSLSRILASVMRPSENAATWSNRVYASRIEPVASRAIQSRAPSSASTPMSPAALPRSLSITSSVKSLKLKCWQRLLMVAGTLWSSVVAKMNTMYGGGSSMVLRSALKALFESMCTSSIMYILYFDELGGKRTSSLICLTFSTEVFDAPSISITSSDDPLVMETHESQTPHGSALGPRSQLSDFASILAVLVLPHPRGPENRYA